MTTLLTRAFEALGINAAERPASCVDSQATERTHDPSEQLNHVMKARFFKRKVMSKAEYAVFRIVEEEVARAKRGFRVFAQTSLGEIIYSNDPKAFSAVNSKRVDIVVVGPYGDAAVAVEYQGSGHYRGTAVIRDAVKREALRKAGVSFLEINVGDSDEITRLRVREAISSAPDNGTAGPRRAANRA